MENTFDSEEIRCRFRTVLKDMFNGADLSEKDLDKLEFLFKSIKNTLVNDIDRLSTMFALCSFAYDVEGGAIKDSEFGITGGDIWDAVEIEIYEKYI